MVKKFLRRLTVMLALLLTVLPIQTLALESPYTNLSADVSGDGSGTGSTGSVSMTVSGSKWSDKTGILTLTNSGTEAAQLSFSYAASGNYSLFTVAGSNASATGSYNEELAAGDSIEIKMTVASSGLISAAKSASVSLTNIKLEVASAADINVSHNGLGTTSVGGTTVDSGTTVEVEATGATFAATPASGATFVGWIDTSDNSVVSTDASFNYVPTGDASIKAIFAHADYEACFWGSRKSYLFESLSAAITHASSASNKTIILAASGTLSSGDYTIPSGVTLLMPFDADGTLYTTSPGYVEDSYTKPSAYRTLTMADGANITVNGAISVSAKVSAKMGSAGAPTSKYGHIAMNEGSAITVNSGGNLFAWGYITGSGTVTVKSGGSSYESFQVVDWRGGTATTSIIGMPGFLGYNTPDEEKVFPMSQYYVQNVEAPMVFESGASEKCSLIADIITVQTVTVPFLGTSGCMFNLTEGTATKLYDGSTDRLVIDIDGKLSISQTEIILIPNSYSINLEDFVLPINNNITININSRSTLTFDQTTSLLPGVQMTIDEGGTVKLGSGAQLFVYDETEWKSNYHVYSNAYFRPVCYAPSQTYTRTNADIVDTKILVNGTLDASAGYLYTTASGANICSTANGVVKVQAAESSHTLYEATQSGTSISYVGIEISAAWLKNEDRGYVTTSGTTTYNYDHHNYCCGTANCAEQHGVWYAGGHTYEGSEECSCGGHAAVKIIHKSGNERFFSSLAAACEKFTTDDSYIQMLTGTTEPGFTIDKNIYLDLNGQDVEISEGKLTINNGCTLYGMDSTTDAYGLDVTSGTYTPGTITGTVTGTVSGHYSYTLGTGSARHYAAYKNGNTYSFHRFRFGMDSYTYYLSPEKEVLAITFSATYLGDANAKSAMAGFGMEVNDVDSGYLEKGATGLDSVTGTNGASGYVLKRTVTDPESGDVYNVSALLKLADNTELESVGYVASVTVSELGG